MTLSRINSDEWRLPRDAGAFLDDKNRTVKYVNTLVDTLERVLQQIIDSTNSQVDLADGEAIYSEVTGSDGKYPVGTWRTIIATATDVTNGNANAAGDRLLQRQTVVDTWVTANVNYGS